MREYGIMKFKKPVNPRASKLHLWLLITQEEAIYYWNHVILLLLVEQPASDSEWWSKGNYSGKLHGGRKEYEACMEENTE